MQPGLGGTPFGGQGTFPFNPFGFPPGVSQPGIFPGGGQGLPGGSGGSPSQVGAPTGPPPSTIPPEPQGVSAFAVDPGGIRRCLYRFTFVRLNSGQSFWYYPTFVGRTSIAGFRWNPLQFRWFYFGIDLERIRSFSC
ncbi:hypothetical protein GJU40_08700 [Bacillus lacus]|uniref:Transporter n=1 Tax=Metabacillus lacus TaxID=1983721 RepID=A0A7X2LZZ2_9BACI|nr:hypothetical protein [Metabacillus lacus]